MNHPVSKTLLALVGAGTFAATASAQLASSPTSYTAGDYLLGFREVGSTNSVVVDIGPITNIAGLTAPMHFTINAGSTLSANYGAGWATNANVFFSLASTDSGDNTSYVTSPEILTGPDASPATVFNRQTNTVASAFQNKINSLGAEFTSNYAANATLPEVQPKTEPNSYQNYMPGGTTDAGHASSGNTSWGEFNTPVEGNFGQGTSGVALDLIQLVPGSTRLQGNDLGTFTLSSDGNSLDYLPVPEPSAYVATGVWGALALLCFQINKRRKSSTKEQAA